MSIPSPKTSPDQPDHVLDCEFVLEPYLHEIAERAQAAGWRPDVVAMALGGLAAARLEMLEANEETGAAIRARRKDH